MPATAVTKMSVVAAQKGPYLAVVRVNQGGGGYTHGLVRDCPAGGARGGVLRSEGTPLSRMAGLRRVLVSPKHVLVSCFHTL